MQIGRVWSCVLPVDAALEAAGPNAIYGMGDDVRNGSSLCENYFLTRDEILIREVNLRHNTDSHVLPTGFVYCAEGLSFRVFTQPGSKAAVITHRDSRPLCPRKQTFNATMQTALAARNCPIYGYYWDSLPRCHRINTSRSAKANKQLAFGNRYRKLAYCRAVGAEPSAQDVMTSGGKRYYLHASVSILRRYTTDPTQFK